MYMHMYMHRSAWHITSQIYSHLEIVDIRSTRPIRSLSTCTAHVEIAPCRRPTPLPESVGMGLVGLHHGVSWSIALDHPYQWTRVSRNWPACTIKQPSHETPLLNTDYIYWYAWSHNYQFSSVWNSKKTNKQKQSMQAYNTWTRWCASIRFSHVPILQIELLVASQGRYCLQLWVCQG